MYAKLFVANGGGFYGRISITLRCILANRRTEVQASLYVTFVVFCLVLF